MQRVGVVIIGRNEGERLRRCLESVIGQGPAVVYVDSGSIDDSVALARCLGAAVVQLDTAQPFTAARARNAGLSRLHELWPNTEHVQFVDGDCEVIEGWFERASNELGSNGELGVVCGRRRERYLAASIYNRLCDMEWNTPVGLARSCGGDAMIRVAALHQVGGYRDDMAAGEEPELCVRLRVAGWKVERIDADMTWHDAAMMRFSQWWRRAMRAGHAYAEGAVLHSRAAERHNVREMRSILAWGLAFPLVALALAWPTWGLSAIGVLSLYGVLWWRVRRHRRNRGDAAADASLYATFCVIGKLAQACGVCRYYIRRRLLRRPAKLIEYKTAPMP